MTSSVAIAWVLTGLSVVLIRLGWGSRRSVALLGWALAALSLILLARSDGAWGIATGVVLGMIVALVIVLFGGWRSPAKRSRAARQAAAVVVPRERSDVLRRVAVFVLVGPVAFIAAQWLAFAGQSLLRGGRPIDADSVAITLFLQPITWAVLMSWQMTLSNPARMIFPPAIVAALGVALWSIS